LRNKEFIERQRQKIRANPLAQILIHVNTYQQGRFTPVISLPDQLILQSFEVVDITVANKGDNLFFRMEQLFFGGKFDDGKPRVPPRQPGFRSP
jgi:hypothetical protein